MTNQDLLTNELTKYILSIFGFANPYIENLIGFTFDKYKMSKISIDYEDLGKVDFPIFSASTKQKDSVLNAVGVRLTDGTDYDFCLVFQCDNLPAFGLKISSTEEKAIFLCSKSKLGWFKPTMAEKIMACGGLELLNDLGIVWSLEPVGDFLHSCLFDLVEM